MTATRLHVGRRDFFRVTPLRLLLPCSFPITAPLATPHVPVKDEDGLTTVAEEEEEEEEEGEDVPQRRRSQQKRRTVEHKESENRIENDDDTLDPLMQSSA